MTLTTRNASLVAHFVPSAAEKHARTDGAATRNELISSDLFSTADAHTYVKKLSYLKGEASWSFYVGPNSRFGFKRCSKLL